MRGTLEPQAAADDAVDVRSRPLRRDVPLALLLVAIAVLAVNMALTVAGGRAAGVSGDEPVHVSRMQSMLDHGWYLPAEHLRDGQPDAAGMAYVYGPAAALPGHLLAQWTGAEDAGTVSTSPEAYDARRFVISLFSFVGLAAVGALGWLALGTWRWGVIAAAMLAAIPMWTGHAMFNIKDIPVAAGYTILTAGLAAAAVAWRRRGLVAAGAAVGIGAFVAVGTRPGMWPAVALGAAVLVACLVVAKIPRHRIVAAGLATGAGLAVAYAGLVWLYPAAFGSPVTTLIESVRASADFPVDERATLLTAGIQHGVRATWFAVPVWFAAQTPLVVATLAAVGLAAAAVLAWRSLRTRGGDAADDRDLARRVVLVLVAVQALALPLAAVVQRAVMYSGVRQLLFVLPAIAVLAAFGLDQTLGWSVLRDRRWWRPAVLTVAALGLVLPTIDQARLFPYGYTYFNAAATLRPITGNWATDYWRVSNDELRASLPPYDPVRERVVTGGQWRGQPIPEGCRPAGEVTRALRWRTVLMQWAAICPIPTYPEGGIDFRAGGNGWDFLTGPWSAPTQEGVTIATWGGGVTLLLPDGLEARPLGLRLTGQQDPGTNPTIVDVTVNGSRVGRLRPAADSRAATFSLPTAVVGDNGLLVVQLTLPRREGRLGLVLQRLELLFPQLSDR